MNKQSRDAIRSNLRRRRRALSALQQRRAASQLAKHFSRSLYFRRAQRIAAYLASDGEINLQPLFNIAWKAGKQIYVPVIDGDHSMHFLRFRRGAPTRTARWGLREPQRGQRLQRNQRLDLVLLPLVAFDAMGNRLGRGGGFYDRYFGPTGILRRHRPALVGAAHAFQQLPAIEAQRWDVKLDAIVTDRRLVIPGGVK